MDGGFAINLGIARNGRVSLSNASLSDCIKFAWSLGADDQLSGPDWIRTYAPRFDIVGEAPRDTPRDRLLLMLRTRLADRLKLAVHHEQRNRAYLVLLPGKNGAKIREAQPAGPPDTAAPSDTAIQSAGHLAGNRMSMQILCLLLSRAERRTILDMTGLKGAYEVSLQWTPENSPDNTAGPSIFTAVQEQLGLRLEARKGPIDVLVVDHGEKIPVDN